MNLRKLDRRTARLRETGPTEARLTLESTQETIVERRRNG